MNKTISRELNLRNAILDKYTSLRKFSIENNIPYSTLMTILSRDIGGASFDTVIAICKVLQLNPFEI